MKLAILLSSTILISSCGTLESKAIQGQAVDSGTTIVGLTLGAVELNPLGLAVIPAKYAAYRYFKTLPEPEQLNAWRAFGASGWGAAANNACVILIIATGGASSLPCLVLFPAIGFAVYNSTEPTEKEMFDAICKEQTKTNPDLICTYSPSPPT